jgi:hypothetical protein
MVGLPMASLVLAGMEVLEAIEHLPVDGETPRTPIALWRVRVERTGG